MATNIHHGPFSDIAQGIMNIWDEGQGEDDHGRPVTATNKWFLDQIEKYLIENCELKKEG